MMINDVNMKKFLFIVALFVQQIDVIAVTVERTVNLNVYYPEYTKIDLVCEQMPKQPYLQWGNEEGLSL